MTIFEYIEETEPREVRDLLLAAHHFLLETLPPFATASLKWRIPFYKLNKNFCYLNRHCDHITLGFPHGWKFAPRPQILLGENENLKQVRYIKIHSIEHLFSDTIQQILLEAIILDEEIAIRKRPISRVRF